MAIVTCESVKINTEIQTPASTPSDDYYTLLEIPQLRRIATPKEIQLAYRKASLLKHPDKQHADSEEQREIAHKKYVAITTAYETLSNSRRRRVYDSSLPFDDSIPSRQTTPQNFYAVFGPVFARNSVFSTKKPVPLLGDESSEYDQVFRFYNFWRRFQSWRDFSYKAKYNTEEAENREERRWMARENQAEISGLVRAEKKRISDLVESAFRNDPRIATHFSEEKARKELDKKERRLKKVRETIQMKKALEKNLAMVKESQRKLKEEKAKEKEKARREMEDILKKIKSIANELQLNERVVKAVLDKYDKTQLEALVSLFENLDETKTTAEKKYAVLKFSCEQLTESDKPISSVQWSRAEVSALSKAFSDFPPGSAGRWDKIAARLNRLGVQRSRRQIMEKAAQMKGKDVSRSREGRERWNEVQRALLEEALVLTRGEANALERWAKIAAIVPEKSTKECILEFKRVQDILQQTRKS